MRAIRTILLASSVAAIGVLGFGSPAGAAPPVGDGYAQPDYANPEFQPPEPYPYGDDLVVDEYPDGEGDEPAPEIGISDGTEIKEIDPVDEEDYYEECVHLEEGAKVPAEVPVCPEGDEPEEEPEFDECEMGYFDEELDHWVGPTQVPEHCDEPDVEVAEDCYGNPVPLDEELEYDQPTQGEPLSIVPGDDYPDTEPQDDPRYPEDEPGYSPEDCDEPRDEPKKGGSLPFTGGMTLPLVIGGLVLAGSGLGLWLASRRRSIV